MYLLWSPEMGVEEERAQKASALCAKDAATSWAELRDYRGAVFAIARGETPVVHVRQEGGDTVETFRVYAETAPTYFAMPVVPRSDNAS